METSNSNRETILNAIRSNLPKVPVEHPGIRAFQHPDGALKAMFEQRLKEAGGAAHDVGSAAEAESKLVELHPDAKVICAAVPEIAGTRRVEKVCDPHDLADVDVGVVRAQFGVAESGAVWLTQEDLVVNALGFLSQHLVVLLHFKQIVPDMHACPTNRNRVRVLHDGAIGNRRHRSHPGPRRSGSPFSEFVFSVGPRSVSLNASACAIRIYQIELTACPWGYWHRGSTGK